MNTNLTQESARIYQFPVGGRAALGGRRREEGAKDAGTASPSFNEAACNGSWYHEAAIRETDGTRDH
ncbi:MAG TPA: DUF2735 domain-containing protein [Bradyrhizobium sp.]|nr:DUF2735 domain-containing protein [Bradyrhizobium sp.]